MNSQATAHRAPFGLRTVALFEFAKGLLVLLAGLGLLSLIHTDVEAVASEIIQMLHFDPARHYPQIFIETAGKLNDHHLLLLSLAAMIYALIRFVETYGLWHERPWAEWFAVISSGLYLPVEVFHFFRHPTKTGIVVFLANLAIVIYLGRLLSINLRRKRELKKKQAGVETR